MKKLIILLLFIVIACDKDEDPKPDPLKDIPDCILIVSVEPDYLIVKDANDPYSEFITVDRALINNGCIDCVKDMVVCIRDPDA